MYKLLIFISLSIPMSLTAQIANLKQMNEQERHEYLVKKSKEVINNFGPGYFRENMAPIVSDDTHTFYYNTNEMDVASEIEPILKKNNGRKYYEVICPYDTLIERLSWDFAAKIRIWEDDGQPIEIFFGNGIGINFLSRPYDNWIKEGIKDDEIIKYQKVEIPQYYIDQFCY